ncbi:hypothetical protein [Actinomyces qiguomingii]|uniref:hypothetical protein n=1 Tax=Actinomyces qiguomingii TaxID=2057800 RepID=UPI001304F400|nr:hypothetical protein [Actinomyces qiguomingii]
MYEVARTAFDSSLSDIEGLFERDVQDLKDTATDFEDTDSQAATDAYGTYPAA